MSASSEQRSQAKTLDDALADYIRRKESGGRFDRQAWLALYPQWADELREFIANHDKMQGFASEMRRRRGAAAAVSPFGTEIKYVGEYELLDQIGQGGMGIVFKARQASLDRLVALKMLLDDSRDRDRFRAEAEAAAALEHPNLVRIYEVGEHEGWPYYTMQFIDGHDLRESVERRPLPPKQVAELVAKLASAVQYAHDRGVLHRDLKPANVLIDKLGEPHITDFGLAKFVADVAQITQTQTGVLLGTPSYMAPEQAEGDTTQVTVGTDVYGLGTILYALLAGRAPFTGDNSLAVLRQVERDAPLAIRSIRSNVPADLETICLKCLEKIPRDRYRSAEALGEDLQRFVAGEPIQARPVSAIERCWRWCLRNPAVSGLAAMLLLLLVGSAIGGIWMARNERLAYQAAETSRIREANARKNVEESLIDSFVAHGRSAHRRSNFAESMLWHTTAADLARSNDQLEIAKVRLAARNFKVATPVRGNLFAGEFVSQLEFHPDGRYLLVGDRAENVVCWDLLNNTPWKPLSRQQAITTAHWSADGKWLLTGSATGQVSLVELSTGTTKLVGQLDGAVIELALDDAANRIVACSDSEVALFTARERSVNDNALSVVNADQSIGSASVTESRKRWKPEYGKVVYVAIDSQGRHFVVQTDNDQAFVFDADEWPETRPLELPHEYQPYGRDRPHPLRPQLFNGNVGIYSNKAFDIFDLATGKLVNQLAIGDSRRMLLCREHVLNCGDRRARLRSLDGNFISRAYAHRGFVVDGDCHPSRNEIALASWDRRVIVWYTRSAIKAHLLPHQGRLTCVRYSPTGALIATAQDDGLVRVWQTSERPTDSWRRLIVPDKGSRALLLDDGVLFTAGTSTGSRITDLKYVDPYSSEPVGTVTPAQGTIHDAVVFGENNRVFALVTRVNAADAEVTELVSASLQDGQVHKRVAIDDRSERLLRVGDQIAVFSSKGAIHVYDQSLESPKQFKAVSAVGGSAEKQTSNAQAKTAARFESRLVIEPWCDENTRRAATHVAAAYGNSATVVDVSAGSVSESIVFDANVSAIALSRDQRLAAAGTENGQIRIWSVKQDGQRDTHASVPAYVYSVRFSPDGKKLLVAAADGARMLEVSSGRLVGRLISHENDVFDAMFSYSGKFIYTLGDNGLVTTSAATDGSFIRHYTTVTGDRAIRPQDRRLWFSRSPDRTRLLVCGLAATASIHDVSRFEKPVPPIDTKRRRALSELVANQYVADGKLHSITVAQWLDRWADYCQQYGTPEIDSAIANNAALRW